MSKNVFYSWQSDRPNNLCRGFIKRALDSAIKELNAELEEANRPDEASLEVDHDTKGLPGSPDIAASILKKIEQARAFVADVTPIGLSDAPEGNARKHLPNPNVMIELGYAKSALGTERIIQIWNTGFTGCGPADLPFDMRGKKGPITYNLDPNTPPEERKRVLGTLTKQLKGAIDAVLATWPTESVPDRWALPDSRDQSIWPHPSDGILVNEPDHGSGVKRVYPFEIRLGVTGLQGLHWPTGANYGARPHAALEPDLQLTYAIKSGDKDELWEIVRDAWLSYRRVFSLPDPGMPEMQQMRFFLTN